MCVSPLSLFRLPLMSFRLWHAYNSLYSCGPLWTQSRVVLDTRVEYKLAQLTAPPAATDLAKQYSLTQGLNSISQIKMVDYLGNTLVHVTNKSPKHPRRYRNRRHPRYPRYPFQDVNNLHRLALSLFLAPMNDSTSYTLLNCIKLLKSQQTSGILKKKKKNNLSIGCVDLFVCLSSLSFFGLDDVRLCSLFSAISLCSWSKDAQADCFAAECLSLNSCQLLLITMGVPE